MTPSDSATSPSKAIEAAPSRGVVRFGRCEVLPLERRVLVDGQPAALGSRAFDLLLTLIERRGRLLSKSELLDAVWPGLVVEENNLTVQVSALRKLLGSETIATIPGRGYRFTARLTDDDLHPAIQRDSAADASQGMAPARLSNLPAQLLGLYGRVDDIDAVQRELDSHRLVTLVGAGGIGKSRLAVAVAREAMAAWPDGVWMVELAGLSDPTLVAQATAHALGITLAGSGSGREELVDRLSQQRLLLVLDNCEHLLDAVADLAEQVLRAAEHVKVLATSQEPLRLAAEQQFRVVPLAVPAQARQAGARDCGAVALFEARVRAAEPRFVLKDDDLPVAIDICRRLDGLPLAIELAAVRVPKLGLRGVRDKLDERFKLLTGGARIALRRHQTLRAALEWSHQLINDDEQKVFRRLGVFAGGFTMELAQAVAADEHIDPWAVIDHLGTLADKSLVATDAGDPPRYRLLESARAYAMEQLACAGETTAILKRHAQAVAALLARVDEAFWDGQFGWQQIAALLAPEFDNVRAAHAWANADGGDADLAVLLAARTSEVEEFAVDWAAWLLPHQSWAERAADPAVAARFWLALASPILMDRIPARIQADAAHRAMQLYRSLGQLKREFASCVMVARHEGNLDHEASCAQALTAARAMVQPDWPPLLRVRLLRAESHFALQSGRTDHALALFREILRIVAMAGDWATEVRARNNLVDVLWQTEPIEVATAQIEELAGLLRTRPTPAGETAIVLSNMVGIFAEMGRIEQAISAAREAWPFMRRSKQLFLDETVYLAWRCGLLNQAARLLGASDAEVARSGLARQRNEQRLISSVRPALADALGEATLAAILEAGGSMSEGELYALIGDALTSLRPLARSD